MVAAGCGSSAPRSAAGAGKPVSGGTVLWAEGPDTPPTYIFPFISSANSSAANIDQFQQLMYRPLYWFGTGDQPVVDYSRSLADAPQFSDGGTTVTIRLKHYVWSDGETVTSRDVVFWINLMRADGAEFYGYVSGYFPDNVTSVTTPDSQTVVMKLNKAYNPTWFLYNQLSLITPLPLAWDRTSLTQPAPTSATSSLPDGTRAGAQAVYAFLNTQSKSPSTWVGSPIWSVVDGPWRLTSFTSTGQATFVPNPKYSGPHKARLAKFVEVPFTSDTSEFNDLRGGGLTVGYIPPPDEPETSLVDSEGYKSAGGYSFSFGYFPINQNNPRIGPLFRQTYFRQALQHLVDQTGWSKAFYHGDATPTYGPVPLQPPNKFISPQERIDHFPYSVSAAAGMLRSHGWSVKPGGTTTCADPGSGPGQCGAGVPAGFGISFNVDYSSGSTALEESMNDFQANAAKVGIQVSLSSHPYASVVAAAAPCTPTQAACGWTAENWGGGWTYLPDFYPSGEELFQSGAVANYENYNDPTANRLIAATTVGSAASSQQALDAYQNYIAEQVPVIYTPEFAGNPIQGYPAAVSTRLGGYDTNVYQTITPEDWYLTK
ncbi:MAG TPA: ABC transporter substrate-binding protein [Acidimicrobiales bacterium]|nr:ABC transporter substrate-binding protein [Acidimicrobiales bacterium]